jgi:GNAT superfamily N-acetyltransferase
MLRLLSRKAATAVRLLRESPREVLRRLLPRFESFVIISTPVTAERLRPPLEGLSFQKLSDRELLSAARSRDEFAPAVELLEVLGQNCAYGAYLDGTLVAMIWLIAYGCAPPGARLLRLREGQAERAQIVTLPEHRGKGIMPWALMELNEVASATGIREFLGLVTPGNVPSLRASRKAGSQKIGRIYRLIGPPFLGSRQWVLRRASKPSVRGGVEGC